MEIAVISDLHLGAKDCADSFGHDDAEFLRFLTFLERRFERIVLLGDIWETLTSQAPWAAEHALALARAKHPEIAARLRGPRYTYIHGNHDWVTQAVDRAPEEWLLEVDGKRLLFTHGHGHDRLMRFARRWVELGVCLGGWLRRAGFHRLYAWFDALDRRRCGIDVAATICPLELWALDIASKARADVIVTGHTHVARVSPTESRLYLNSGSCSRGQFSYLALDTRRDVYGAHAAW